MLRIARSRKSSPTSIPTIGASRSMISLRLMHGFRRRMPPELGELVGDFEPRRFVSSENVRFGTHSGIVIETTRRNVNALRVNVGNVAAAHRTEYARISRWHLSYSAFVFSDQRLTSDPSKIRRLANQLSHECGAARFPASRAMIECKIDSGPIHLVLHTAAQAASFHSVSI